MRTGRIFASTGIIAPKTSLAKVCVDPSRIDQKINWVCKPGNFQFWLHSVNNYCNTSILKFVKIFDQKIVITRPRNLRIVWNFGYITFSSPMIVWSWKIRIGMFQCYLCGFFLQFPKIPLSKKPIRNSLLQCWCPGTGIWPQNFRPCGADRQDMVWNS